MRALTVSLIVLVKAIEYRPPQVESLATQYGVDFVAFTAEKSNKIDRPQKVLRSGPPNHAPGGRRLSRNLREVGNRRGGGADGREQRQAIGPDIGVLVVHQHVVEERIDRPAQLR